MSLKHDLVTWLSRPSRRIESLRTRVATLRAEAGAWKLQTDGWKQKAGQRSRRVLNTHVLRQIFELRAETVQARAAIPPRDQREAMLREISAAYVAAVDQGPAAWGERAHRMRIRNLNWWMPVLRPRPSGPSAAWIAKQRFPYRALTQTRELAVGGIMLDIGANIGRMSISRVVLGDVVAAYCAEPDPLNYACLVGNIVDNDLHGLLMPDHLAIADRDGTVVLRRADVSGGHRVLADDAAVPVGTSKTTGTTAEGEHFVEVPCLTLDTWLARLRVDPDAVTFVKVDVQGFEMRVLQGASSLLARRHVAWQMEIDPALLAKAGTSLADMCAKVQQHFTHFIDMNGAITCPRHRTIKELPQGLAYIAGTRDKTDVLLYCASH
jgi:FkbM family methyltransferase